MVQLTNHKKKNCYFASYGHFRCVVNKSKKVGPSKQARATRCHQSNIINTLAIFFSFFGLKTLRYQMGFFFVQLCLALLLFHFERWIFLLHTRMGMYANSNLFLVWSGLRTLLIYSTYLTKYLRST